MLAVGCHPALSGDWHETRTDIRLALAAVAPATARSYASALRLYLRALPRERRHEWTSPALIKRWLWRRIEGGQADAKGLVDALNWALDTFGQQTLPAAVAKRAAAAARRANPRAACATRPKTRDMVPRVVSWLERNRLWGTLDESPRRPERIRTRAIVALTLSLASRQADLGELLSEVRRTEETIYVRFGARKQDRGVSNRWPEQPLDKLPEEHSAICAYQALSAWIEVSSVWQREPDETHMFTSCPRGAGKKVCDLSNQRIGSIRRDFLRQQCGLEGARSHQLRAAVCTHWQGNGVDSETIMRRLSASDATTLRRYYLRAAPADINNGLLDRLG